MTSSLWQPMAILVLGKSAANDNLMNISNHLKGIDFSSNVLDCYLCKVLGFCYHQLLAER
jgi:hypothetical protein